MRLHGRPGERLIEIPTLDELADPRQPLGGISNRSQQGHEPLAMGGAGILLQGARERQVPGLAALRDTARISGEKRKRIILVALVLREMKRHAADDAPERVPLVQVGPQALAAPADFAADRGIDVDPCGAKGVGIEIFDSLHRRGIERQGGKLIVRRRLDPRPLHLTLGFPEMTELRHVALPDAAREGESRWK
jgi:hypothetical protein